MNLDEMKATYTRVMGFLPDSSTTTFTVRLWDGMDGVWCDVVANVDLAFALRTWCERTKDGTEKVSFGEIDYFKIFPADTHMLYSDGFTMRGDD